MRTTNIHLGIVLCLAFTAAEGIAHSANDLIDLQTRSTRAPKLRVIDGLGIPADTTGLSSGIERAGPRLRLVSSSNEVQRPNAPVDWTSVDNNTRRTLCEYALNNTFLDPAPYAEDWSTYKNSSAEVPRLYDLGGGCMRGSCDFLASLTGQDGFSAGVPTLYERTVILLRKGDSVVFSGKRFVLDQYIGSNEKVHAFRIKAPANVMILIPFSPTSYLQGPERLGDPQQARLADIRDGLRRHVRRLEQYGSSLQPITVDAEFRYALYTGVEGGENGFDFLSSMASGSLQRPFDTVWPRDFKPRRQLRETERKRLDQLLRTMLGDGFATRKGDELWIDTKASSEYAWDTRLNRWVLAGVRTDGAL